MMINLINNTNTEPIINFHNGISLTKYKKLNSRWNEVLSIVHKEIINYIGDDNLCFDDEEGLFPVRSKLTGNYYIKTVSYIKRINPIGFQIMIDTSLTELSACGEDDYLGLTITLFAESTNAAFIVWGIDSYVI